MDDEGGAGGSDLCLDGSRKDEPATIVRLLRSSRGSSVPGIVAQISARSLLRHERGSINRFQSA